MTAARAHPGAARGGAVRPLTPDDAPWALALNEAVGAAVSPLTPARFEALRRASRHALAVGSEAFLLAFDETADYDSPNFLWFRARHPRFTYVDRVAVADGSRRKGLGRALYAALFAAAAADRRPDVACEVNVEPPNPRSDAFHAALGFTPVGEGAFGAKRVRYLMRAQGAAR
jgi:Predicted acetyltransferase, GNAT superfamily